MERLGEFLTVCWNFILTISLWDVLDMAIIALLVYKLLTYVRKTNSSYVVKGIVFMVAVLWLTSTLHLSVVSYLLGKTLDLGILALIVIFQPEIRTLFEQLGNSSFKGLFSKQVEVKLAEAAISHTVAACADMSRERVGALIVFEREIKLDSYINTGTIVDAAPSAELFKNLFYPKSPLHDGAVIVRDGRIASAACMLPLSSNTGLSRDLGMRHRAGVGMSERSDAVVVIVSEENGAISIAMNGMLKRHLTLGTFEKLLTNELVPKEETKSVWKTMKSKLRLGGTK